MASASYAATEEMTNINRVSRLLMGPCTDQLRDLLRVYIPPASFPSVIQRERNRLPRLTEPQRKLILPNSGVFSGNYEDMDISLLYILLRNVCGIQTHNRGWGNTPASADRSVSANIERLRLARNQCGHSIGGMCFTEFNQIWSEIKAAVVELDKVLQNKHKYQKIVDFVRNDTMDPVRDKHYRDQLLEQIKEIENIVKEIDSLKSCQQEINGRVLDIENSNIPPNIKVQHKTLLESWWKEDVLFHEIHSFPNILDKVKSQPITTIIGCPGSGKTTTARHLALRLQTDCGFEIVPVLSVSNIIDYGHPKCKQLFILDDVFGIFGFTYKKLTKLERYRESIFNVLGKLSKILFTCRKAVYNEASNLMSFVLNEKYIVDLEDSINALNVEDRKQILNNHCKQNDVSLSPKVLSNVSNTVGCMMMYPLVCKLFCSESKYQKMGEDFFENPSICIHEEIDHLQRHNNIHYASLVLCMICKNKITESMMTKKDPKFMEAKEKVFENCRVIGRNSDIKDALDNMIDTFTVRINEGYSLIHDAVYEVLASHYGNKHQEDLLEYMSSSFVANKFIVNGIFDNIGDLHIKIHENHYQAFAQRLVRDLKSLELYDVFMNKSLKFQCICDALIDELKELSYTEIKKLFFQNLKFSWNLFQVDNVELDRQCLLTGGKWEDNNIRAISWVISYGHRQLLLFLFDQVTEHQESIRRVMDLEIRGENGNGFISNIQEQSRLLSLSCYSGDVEVVKLLLKHCDVECFDGSFNSECTPPLVAACRVGQEELIPYEASIDLQGDRSTPIYAASRYGHVDVANLLIKCGADCNQSDKWGMTPIHAASEAGHVDVVDMLIKCGADCNQRDKWGMTPIHKASKAGHVDVVDMLIKCGADCNQSDKWCMTPIHAASEAGHVNVVDMLIKCGAYYNQSDKWGMTPIHEASEAGHVDIVDMLIKCGADCNQSDKWGMTPIHAASEAGHVDVVDMLIKCGADCNQSDKWGMTPIHAASEAVHVDVVDLLIKGGADCNQSVENGRTLIYRASLVGHVDVVDLLIKGGADCNQRDEDGRTLIHKASEAGHVDVVDLLIKGGVDCNQIDKYGRTAIHKASEAGHVEVVDFLIKCGADCNHSDEDGRTPIHEASEAGHVDVVDLLIKGGADCNQSDKLGRFPIHEASLFGRVDVVNYLIKCGVDCNQSDKYGRTPIHAASLFGKGDVVELLIEYGVDCNKSNDHGETPLHYASFLGHGDVLDFLIKGGADCNHSDKDGRTPIHKASKNGHVNVVDLLMKGGADCNHSDEDGRTPIYDASEAGHGHIDVVDLLIKGGADCNHSDKYGRTPMHVASEAGGVDVVDLLIKCCADCNQSDKHGITPIHEAALFGRVDVVDMLIKGGAYCNQSDKDGRTPLHAASEAGHSQLKNKRHFFWIVTSKPEYESTVRALIGSGADINQCDINGQNPLSVAIKYNQQAIAELLFEHGAKSKQIKRTKSF